MKHFFKLVSILTRREKRNLILLLFGMVIVAFAEVLGIGAIGPFMSVAADPGMIDTNPLLSWAYDTFGFESNRSFLVALGVLFFGLVLSANALTTVVMYWVFRWSQMRSYTLGRRLLSQYLYQPYSYFLDHNTSELSKNILTEVQQVVQQAMIPMMQMFARGTVAVAIFLFLIFTEPVVALTVVAVLGGAYAGIFAVIHKLLVRLGEERREYNRGRFKASGEAFGAIKDVKILGKEPVFEKQFGESAKGFAWTAALARVLTGLPKYGVEALALGLVVLYTTVVIGSGAAFASAIPVISLYAFAGYRMTPALQEAFQAVSKLRTSKPVVEALVHDLTSGVETVAASRQEAVTLERTEERLPFNDHLELKDIQFTYASSPAPVLKRVSLTIEKNTTVAFVGPTGCGKTTLVDVILGLLEPEGEILVDKAPIDASHMRRWQRNFGYVPQQIFLADETVTRNIAFGIEPKNIDREAVERAARIAHLHNFVAEELPEGYDTLVGERGIRLSGGQRQRVGIARALYHNPDILVFDEATSSLDTMTEDAVMGAIHELMGRKTIIMIAHRLTTVREADVIYLLEEGRIVASGGYDALLAHSERFRSMAKL